ncbi:MAG: hypothetical protein ACO28M_06915 [Vulcanococcus sp.]
MPITINGSGTVTGLSAGGLPDGSITTDDLAANAVTAAKLAAGAGGKILQVVSAVVTTRQDLTTTTPTSRVSLSLTPASSSNKVLLFYHQGDCLTDSRISSAFYRNGSSIRTFTTEIGRGATNVWMMVSGMYLDSPSTTSAITYAVYHWNYAGTGTASIGDSSMPGVLTAMEVAA